MAEVQTLTNSQISHLNKDELKKYATNITQAYRNLYDKLFNESTGVIPRLEYQLTIATNTNKLFMNKLIEVEKVSNGNAQYSRKESIELQGFNPETPNEQIEEHVIEILNLIKEDDEQPFTKDDIQACHKLKKKSNVICKFISRRRMRSVISNRKKLKNKDLKQHHVPGGLYIVESMTPAFNTLDWKCRQLRKANIIENCWFFNGNYTIVKNNVRHKIYHDVDIEHVTMLDEDEITAICEEWKDKKVKFTRE